MANGILTGMEIEIQMNWAVSALWINLAKQGMSNVYCQNLISIVYMICRISYEPNHMSYLLVGLKHPEQHLSRE